MKLCDLLSTLKSNDAFIVHCSRSNRGGELQPKPIYPEDLKATIRDLAAGGVRPVSCSVVWPAHQETFGEIGIIVKPRSVGEIVRVSTEDGGTLDDGQGLGEPLSSSTVAHTFAFSKGHNEWLLSGGEVVGIFLNFAMGLYVARIMDTPIGISAEEAEMLDVVPEPYPVAIKVSEVSLDFPGLPLFGFMGGALMEIAPTGTPVAPQHPY